MVGNQFLSHKEMQNKALSDVLQVLRERHGIDPYTVYSPSSIYGVLIKKKQYPHVGFNPKTGQAVPTIRARIEARTFDWSNMEELPRTAMLNARLWEDVHPASLEHVDLDS